MPDMNPRHAGVEMDHQQKEPCWAVKLYPFSQFLNYWKYPTRQF
jgi:hypothetical protein